MPVIRSWFTCFCLVACLGSIAHAQRIGVTPIAFEQGLPSLTVNRTFQDSEGYIWFATAQGISRYDAFNVLSFDLKDEGGKAATNQNITNISESEGRLLLGTEIGLYVLDKKTYSVHPFPDEGLKGRFISAVIVDGRGNIWVGTSNGIHVYDKGLSPLRSYQHDPQDSASIPEGSINTIFEDSRGDIWISVWNNGLFKLVVQTGRFVRYPPIGNRNNPFRLLEDSRGQFWICTWGDGLFLFNPDNPDNMYREIIIKNKRRSERKEELFYNIVQDDDKKYIWILSFSGIATFEYTAQGGVRPVDLSSLFDDAPNMFNDIFKDRSGNLWLAVNGKGVSTISFDKPAIRNFGFGQIRERYNLPPNLDMLYQGTDGQLWFNLDRMGFGRYDPSLDQIETFSNTIYKDILSLRAVSCAIEFGGEMWVGASYEPRINVFRKKGAEITFNRTIDLAQQVPHAGRPLFFYRDGKDGIWLATTTGVLTKHTDTPYFAPVAGITDFVTAITQDTQGHLWIATRGSGIYQLGAAPAYKPIKQLDQATPGLETDQIETMAADKNGLLWIGTKDGRLLSHRIQDGNVTEYANTSLFAKNQLLDIICLDSAVWLSTTRSIYRISPKTKGIVEYTVDDGIEISMFAKRAYAADPKTNAVYFGGYNGLVRFDEFRPTPSRPMRVLISDVKINNESAVLHSLHQKLDFPNHALVLDPEDQSIEINFSSLEYTHPNKVRYAYKLEGVDMDWVYPPRDRLFATYNNLAKGEYRFLVRATDLNNAWASDITEMAIRKTPAFYESNLAYLMYVLAAMALAFVIVRFTLNRLKLRSDLKIAQIEKDKANELVQTKIGYFTNISHDLLTPLTIISCLVDDVQMTTKKNLSQFEKMRFNLDRLKRLLQQILDFRRVENQQMKLKVSQSKVAPFINEISSAYFGPLAAKKKISFEVIQAEGVKDAYFDMDKLDKILFNLLSNAFKYTQEGGKITLGFGTLIQDGRNSLLIEVKDSGIGIAPEELEKIFIPFYNNRHSKQRESNGIGLALTKELVEIHHGTISVESIAGHGTCFTVVLPIDKDSYDSDELHDIPEDHYLNGTTAFGTEAELLQPVAMPDDQGTGMQTSLLVVEDNEELLQSVQRVLSRDYRVYTASQGEEALQILAQRDIDIVVSDIMMPVMDGLTLCRRIKANADINHIPVILLTAKSSIDDRIECYNAGADGYVSKPFELKVLQARINSFVINKRAKQAAFKENPQINISTLEHTPTDERFLNKMIKVIEENLSDERFDVVLLSGKIGLSKSTLYRKTKVLLGMAPSEFIRNIRLKHACQLMEKDGSISVSEVAFAVGFSDPRYFSTCFKNEFGMTPTEFQKKQ